MAETEEQLAQEITASTADLLLKHGEIRAMVEAQGEEIKAMKAKGATAPETPPEIAAKIDELDKAFTDSNVRLGQMQAEIVKRGTENTELQARLQTWEKAAEAWQRKEGRPGNTFLASEDEDMKSAGQRVFERLSAIKASPADFARFEQASKKFNGTTMENLIAEPLKSFAASPGYGGARRPANIEAALGGDATPNFFVAPYQIPGWVPQARRRLTIRNLIPSVTAGDYRAIHYLRKRGFTTAIKSVVTSITRVGSVATVTQAGHGYETNNYIEISDAVQGEYNGLVWITKIDADTYTFTVSGTPATPATTATALHARNMTAFGAAAWTPEGDLKPEAEYKFDEKTAAIETLAHYMKVKRQIMDDLPGLRANIDFDLIYGLAFKEELSLLYGTGINGEIDGILAQVGVQEYNWSSGKPGDIKWDAMRRARTRSELMNYTPDAVVLNPLDWEDIETVKGNTGYYIYMPGLAGLPVNAAGQDIARLAVVVTPAIRPGTFVLGPWGSTAVIYDRETAVVRFTDSDGDDFKHNLLTILAEQREAAVWKVPESFVKGTFDNAPTP